jgi:hypothetical protein
MHAGLNSEAGSIHPAAIYISGIGTNLLRQLEETGRVTSCSVSELDADPRSSSPASKLVIVLGENDLFSREVSGGLPCVQRVFHHCGQVWVLGDPIRIGSSTTAQAESRQPGHERSPRHTFLEQSTPSATLHGLAHNLGQLYAVQNAMQLEGSKFTVMRVPVTRAT